MTWVRLDDQFPDHPKIDEAGPEAAWLFVAGLCYCGAKLTDGEIPKGRVGRLTSLRRPQVAAEKLVEVGLWHDKGSHYEVHDYTDYQPSKAKVEAQREAARKRQEKFRGSHGVTEPVTTGSPSDDDPPVNGFKSSDDDSPLTGALSSWSDDEVYLEAGRLIARCHGKGDSYAAGCSMNLRSEKAHLLEPLRERGYDLDRAAFILAQRDADSRLSVDPLGLIGDDDFVPADSITAGEAQ